MDPDRAFGFYFTLTIVIVCVVLWFSRHRIGHKIRDSGAQANVRSVELQSLRQFGAVNNSHQQERAGQLNALQAAVPVTPPQRMRATIQLNRFKTPITEKQFYELRAAEVQTGVEDRFSVDMILELSEAERGIVNQHELWNLPLDDEPMHNNLEIGEMRRNSKAQVNSVRGVSETDFVIRGLAEQARDVNQLLAKEARRQTCLIDLLQRPYTRTFDHPHEAKQYSDRLTNRILPDVRKLLDAYRGHQGTQTIEF